MSINQATTLLTTLTPVGYIRTPYKEKFSVPRQANLVTTARSQLYLTEPFNHPESIEGLSNFSHLWLLFLFDKHLNRPVSNSVRPPRLGGNKKVGVFASRSPFRPNFIGMSAVKLLSIKEEKQDNAPKSQIILELSNTDLVDNTPIIDIKPYINYSDCILNTQNGYAEEPPCIKQVKIDEKAVNQLTYLTENKDQLNYMRDVIIETLSLDPRPAYRLNKIDFHQYAVHLFDFNVLFHVESDIIWINSIELAK